MFERDNCRIPLLSLRARIVLVATPAKTFMEVTNREIGQVGEQTGIQLDALSKVRTNKKEF